MRHSNLKRIVDIFWIGVLALILFGLICAGSQEMLPVYFSKGNLFSKCFNEPIEKVVFVAKNGNSYAFTNHMEERVVLPLDELVKTLGEDGLEIKDLMLIVHNHIGSRPRFSLADLKYHTYMREKGFNGWFLLWSSPRGKITDWIAPSGKIEWAKKEKIDG